MTNLSLNIYFLVIPELSAGSLIAQLPNGVYTLICVSH